MNPTKCKVSKKEKKPMNAFFVYRKHMRQKITHIYKVTKSQEISKIAGQAWAMEPEHIKNHYYQLALLESSQNEKRDYDQSKTQDCLNATSTKHTPVFPTPITFQQTSMNHYKTTTTLMVSDSPNSDAYLDDFAPNVHQYEMHGLFDSNLVSRDVQLACSIVDPDLISNTHFDLCYNDFC
ncbi:hypothetical protein HDV02_005520 [Globomyces sp. JEL0801]|nr:hypothetical protein HDV02_005520 [Globomyces sp. JEL0801]